MGTVKHAVRGINDGGLAVPVRRQPPLVVGYEHFRLDRQGQLLSPKTLVYYDETVLPFARWLEAEFRIHAHAFRHTFATVAAKMGWNFEHLRAAMGHSDYGMLQRYVRLATERDLGSRADWIDMIASNPAMEWK